MDNDLFQQRHNFAVWAAARASQRGLTNEVNLRDALEKYWTIVNDYEWIDEGINES